MTNLIAILALAACTATTPKPASDGPRALAITYLDTRARAWLADPPDAGQNTPCALSCHTTVPVMMLGAPSSTLDALRARVEARVDAWPDVVPFYGHHDAQARRSLATEAVLNAVTLPSARAFVAMWKLQRDDGAWDWLDFGLEPWEAGDDYGATLAALAVGTAALHGAGVDRLAGYLQRRLPAMKLHDRAMLLWASSRWPGVLSDAQRGSIAGELERAERSDGGWSFFGDDSDAYATALASLALCESPAAARGLTWLARHQRADGSWPGKSANAGGAFADGLASDAATAFAVMAQACSMRAWHSTTT